MDELKKGQQEEEWIPVPIYGCMNDLDVVWLLDGIARSRQNVLLLGETGTGKSFLAEKLYHLWEAAERKIWEVKRRKGEEEKKGAWKDWGDREQEKWKETLQKEWQAQQWRLKHPLVVVNLVAAGKHLAASELFGSVEGGFTSAVDRPGAIEQANNGMLFLDELGHVDKSVQAQLLMTIQSGEARRLGSTKPVTGLKIRYVAASSPPYERILPELAYRLGYALEIKPLSEIREQIVRLAEKFLREEGKRRSEEFGKLSTDEPERWSFSDKAAIYLREREWPGNVRQLKSVINIVVSRATSPTIELGDVKQALAWDPTKYVAPAAEHDLLTRLRDLFRQGAFSGTPFRRKDVLRILCEEFVKRAPTKKDAAKWVGYTRTEELDRALADGDGKNTGKSKLPGALAGEDDRFDST